MISLHVNNVYTFYNHCSYCEREMILSVAIVNEGHLGHAVPHNVGLWDQ